MQPVLPPKKDCATQLLTQTSLFIHLDPRASGVMVPPWFRKQPHLVLQVGLNMAVPIHDLRVEDEGISCTLSFNRAPFFCVMPWSAIFALSGEDGRGVIWPDEVPFEVAPQFGVTKSAPPPKVPHLRAVPAAEASSVSAADVATPPEPTPKLKKKVGKKAPATAEVEVKAKKAIKKKSVESDAPKATKPRVKKAARGARLADTPIREAPKSSPLLETAPPQPLLADSAKLDDKKLVTEPPRSKRELPPYLRIVK